MSTPLTPLHLPVTAEDCADMDGNAGWASRCKFAGNKVRPVGLTIEGQSQRMPDYWAPILLPGGGTQFASVEDRDTVLGWIQGEAEIPDRAGASGPSTSSLRRKYEN